MEEGEDSEEWPTGYTEYTERGRDGEVARELCEWDANGGKWAQRSGPRNTRMTRKGDERWKTAEMKTETEFFYHERRETHERQRAGAGKLPANCAKGRDWKKVDSEEWPTEYTEDTEWGTFFYHETHETHERRRAGARDLRSGGYETGIFARGASSRSEGFVQAYRRAQGCGRTAVNVIGGSGSDRE